MSSPGRLLIMVLILASLVVTIHSSLEMLESRPGQERLLSAIVATAIILFATGLAVATGLRGPGRWKARIEEARRRRRSSPVERGRRSPTSGVR